MECYSVFKLVESEWKLFKFFHVCLLVNWTWLWFYFWSIYHFLENQILNKLDTVLSSQHLSSSIVVETKSVGLATAEESVQEPTTRPEWRPKSLKVGYRLLNAVL